MLVSFLFIRTSARLMRSPEVPWWPGSIQTEGGLHVHHLVFGIVLMLLAGFVLALGQDSPWLETRRDWSLLRALDPTIDQSLRRLTIDPKKATGGGGYG
jgi:hypothetical protein